MGTSLRVLIVEDRPDDAELMIYELRRAGFAFDWQRVQTEEDYMAALRTGPDLILADHSLPDFDASHALRLLKESGQDIPFIVVTGSVHEEVAVERMKQGAADYLLKDRLARLGEAAKRALGERKLREEQRRAQVEIERHNRELTLLNRVITAASASLQIEEVLTVACRELAIALDVPQSIALLLGGEHSYFTYVASYPPDRPIVGKTLTVEGNPAIQWLQKHKAPLVVPDVERDPRPEAANDLVKHEGVKAMLILPLLAHQQVSGAIALEAAQPRYFDEAEVRLVSSVAAALSQAVENALLYEELGHYSQFLERAVNERTDELRRTKDHIEAVLNSVGEAIMVVNPDGRIRQVNPAFEAQTGYTTLEVEMQRHHELLLDTSMPSDVFKESSGAMRSGQGWRGEMPVRRKDGTIYEAAVTITPMRDEQGEVIAFVGALRDISPLKEVARLKDEFASNVSHELRTPIAGLKLNHELIAMDPEGSTKYLERLGREIDRLNFLIEDLLRLSRLDQMHTALELNLVDLGALAAQYLSDRMPLAESKDLTFAYEADKNLPLAQADEGLIGQVLSILLTNAFNYTPRGGQVTVSVQSERYEGRQWVGFQVSDTGPGIPPEEQAYLFERFYRGSAGQKSGAPGTGLGLAIAKEIVDRHQGRIEVESQGIPGEGVTFTVWLPVSE